MKAIIVAYSDNRIIGNHGVIPWMGKVPADMQHVRQLTVDQAIIMGRTTFESIGQPLPKRQNIVLTSNPNFKADGVYIANSLAEGLELVEASRNSFIFGGAKVYAEALERAEVLGIETVFATEIHGIFEGDASFPELNKAIWREVDRIDLLSDEKNKYAYSFVRYDRITS